LRRKLISIPFQIIGIVTITFILVRIIPGDPARLMMGPNVPEAGVQMMRERLGLTGSIAQQYIDYLISLCHGELGFSWVTGNKVIDDIIQRLPATLELLLYTLLVIFLVMIPIAFKAMSKGESKIKKTLKKILFTYGMAAGSFPDFWLALILVFLLYVILGLAPAPVGRLDIGLLAPKFITGMYSIDSLLTGNWKVFLSSLHHLMLPVFVLSFVYGGTVIKTAIISAMEINKSTYIEYFNVCGLPISTMEKYIKKASYVNVIILAVINFGFLIGGAVLVETVFSWPGFGRYAVQSVVNADFAAIQGVVLFASILNLIAYILADAINIVIDPRFRKHNIY